MAEVVFKLTEEEALKVIAAVSDLASLSEYAETDEEKADAAAWLALEDKLIKQL